MHWSLRLLSLIVLYGTSLASNAHAGIVVVNNDDWTLSNEGFIANGTSTSNFVRNIVGLFSHGHGSGNFLIYSADFGLTGEGYGPAGTYLSDTITSTGSTLTVSTSVPFTANSLAAYDGVFLLGPTDSSIPGCGLSFTSPHCGYPDNQVLTDYVNAGGNVYVGAGLEWNPDNERIVWQEFLNTFGLGYAGGSNYNGVAGNVDFTPYDPVYSLFSGVSDLYFLNGDNVTLTDPPNSDARLFSINGNALFGVYDAVFSPVTVPEPSPVWLLLLGLSCLLLRRPAAKMY